MEKFLEQSVLSERFSYDHWLGGFQWLKTAASRLKVTPGSGMPGGGARSQIANLSIRL